MKKAKRSAAADLVWVTVQIVLLAALLTGPEWGPLPWLQGFRPVGWALVIGGLLLAAVATWQLHRHGSLTPMPSPRHGARLLARGCYRWVRHPVYIGLLLWAFGTALLHASALHLGLVFLLVLFFHFKAVHEERLLLSKYPEYAAYATRTGRFLPRY